MKQRGAKRKLAFQSGERKDGPWEVYELPSIPSSLSPLADVTGAKTLAANQNSGACYQGQTHGHKGFLLTFEERDELIRREPEAEDVTFPFLNAEELIGSIDSQPTRFVIDFQPRKSLLDVMSYKNTFGIIKERVLPAMIENAEKEKIQYENSKKKVTARQNHLNTWWFFLEKKRGIDI